MIGLLFPGQGTQRIGMGQALSRRFPDEFMALMDEATALCPDLPVLLRRGPAERLSQTQNAQLAVTTVNLGALAVLRSHGVGFDVIAGHSVGLLSALVAADCLDAPAALALAAGRGTLMGALPAGGAMVSLRGVQRDVAVEIARRATAESASPVVVALVNGPDTAVLSGSRRAVERAVENASHEGISAKSLAVSHAFHSPLMAPALAGWRRMVAGVKLRPATVPIIADTSGEALTAVAELREYLTEQLTATIRWDLVCERLRASGRRRCIEVGDSKTLRAFALPYSELSVASMANPQTLAYVRNHGRLPEPPRVLDRSLAAQPPMP